MKKILQKLRHLRDVALLGLVILMVFSGTLMAEKAGHLLPQAKITVKGKVLDDTGNGLPGVTIVEKGTTNGTITDANGAYAFSVSEQATLVVSYIGFKTKELPLNGRSVIDIQLEIDSSELDEIVVVGYGELKKSDVTGAIASVSRKEIEAIPAMNVGQSLQGKAAGVDISMSGQRQVGANPTIRIRGNRSINAGNEPLIVVDGIPFSGNLNDINPNDIASVEILKDASSTAIYGSRGANGVVLISTLRGKEGTPTITYNAYYGFTQPLGNLDWMNADQYLLKQQYSIWNDMNRVGDLPSPEEVLDPVEYQNYLNGVNTDWQDLTTDNGSMQNHQLSIRGGSEETKYSVSFNYFNEKGLLANTNFDRLSLRINLDQKVNSWLKFGTSTFVSARINNRASEEVPFRTYLASPLGVPYDQNGELIYDPVNDGLATNPLMDLQSTNFQDETRAVTIFPSVFAEVEFTEGFTYRMNMGPEVFFNRRGLFEGSNSLSRGQGTPYSGVSNSNRLGYTFENILNFTKDFDQHTINATGVFSNQYSRTEDYSFYGSGQPYESSLFYNLGSAPVIESYNSDLSEWSIMSFMGRLNYDFKDKYLLTFAMRADGSSRLAEGNKWAYFPSGAFAWRISEEDFLQSSEMVSDLKLRVSYGITGNTGIDPYQTQGGLSSSVYAFGDNPAFGFQPGSISNSSLGWEKSATLNLGLDFGFFQRRVTGSVEWYQTNTSDLLLQRQLPTTSGFGSVLQNIGETKNTGWELTVGTVNTSDNSRFKWDTQINLFANQEEIVSLFNGEDDDLGNRWFIGQPVQVFFDYEQEGLFQLNEESEAEARGTRTGGIKVRDINGDGEITPDDRTILGSPLPDLSGGITNNFSYKNWSFSFFIFARLGQEISSIGPQLFSRFNTFNVDYWTPDNPVNRWHMPGVFTPIRPETILDDGSFVRVRNINLSYNLPQGALDRIGLNGCKLYITAQNPFLFSNYKFTDPEVDDGVVSPFVLPNTSALLFGIDVKL